MNQNRTFDLGFLCCRDVFLFRGQDLDGSRFASPITRQVKASSTVWERDSREMLAEIATDFKIFREKYLLPANV